MTITWYGHSCFKIVNQGGRLTIILDPFDKSIGLTPPRGTFDIVTVSHQHQGHNNIQSAGSQSFMIGNPGEYEIKGASIFGLSSFHDATEGKDQGQNTIYIIEMDKIRLCHLGDLGQPLTNNQLEEIGEVDILMIPVGGQKTIDAPKAVAIVEQIEPHIIIPMHYKLPGLKEDLDSVDKFLKEMGVSQKTTVERLVLKKKELITKEMEVVVMKI